MKLLLDTHIWIWLAHEPEKLGRRTAELLIDSRNELWLSPVSLWEFLALAAKRRFPALRDPLAWMNETLDRFPLRDAPLSRDVAFELAHFELSHKDPADKLLVATARVLGCELVTADARIVSSGTVAVVPND